MGRKSHEEKDSKKKEEKPIEAAIEYADDNFMLAVSSKDHDTNLETFKAIFKEALRGKAKAKKFPSYHG